MWDNPDIIDEILDTLVRNGVISGKANKREDYINLLKINEPLFYGCFFDRADETFKLSNDLDDYYDKLDEIFGSYTIDDKLNLVMLRSDISRNILPLDEKEIDILNKRFDLEYTLGEIGANYGYSIENVRRIKNRTLGRISPRFRAKKLNDYS